MVDLCQDIATKHGLIYIQGLAMKRKLNSRDNAVAYYEELLAKNENISNLFKLHSEAFKDESVLLKENNYKYTKTYNSNAFSIVGDETNELEKVGLNDYSRNNIIIFSLEDSLGFILKDIFKLDVGNPLSDEYRLISRSLLNTNFKLLDKFSLDDLSIDISDRVSYYLQLGSERKNLKDMSKSLFTLDIEDSTERGIYYILALILRHCKDLVDMAMVKIFNYLKNEGNEIIFCSYSNSNFILYSESGPIEEDFCLTTNNGNKLTIKPINVKPYEYFKKIGDVTCCW